MEKSTLVNLIEGRYSRKPPARPSLRLPAAVRWRPRDGFSVVVIGGGIAGPAFVKRILALAVQLGLRINVTLVSRPSCNYCGGLITSLSLRTLRGIYDYEPGPEVVLSQIDEVVLVNSYGSAGVLFESALASAFRTSRFGHMGLDDSIRRDILADLPPAAGAMLSVVEPAVATSIELPTETSPGSVTVAHGAHGSRVEADLVVLATGLRSLQSKLISSFTEMTGYHPPPTMAASVTEVDLSNSAKSGLGRRMLILNGIVPGSLVAVIPKQVNWLTVAALNRVLTMDDLQAIFAHPSVREYVTLDDVRSSLPCNRICASDVFVGAAKDFYGDGWVVLGDLAGYGRVLKDGYFAALLGAELAAGTVAYHGCTREAFARNYHARLRQFKGDNRMGMELFALNNLLARSRSFNRAMVEALSWESARHPYGGLVHAAFRALSTGELSYRLIMGLFMAGFANWASRNPAAGLAVLLRRGPSRTT